MNFQSFTKSFLATLGVVCSLATTSLAIIFINGLLTTAEYKTYINCEVEALEELPEEEVTTARVLEGIDKETCGTKPAVYIWQK